MRRLSVKGVTQVEQAHASHDWSRTTLAATNGFSGSYVRTAMTVGASAIAGTGLGRERDYHGETRRHRADMPPPEEIGRRAGEWAVERLGPRKPPGGAVPVLFDRRVASSLISHILGAINGNAVARGASWLMDRMDQQILPAGMDLIEEPLRRPGHLFASFRCRGNCRRNQSRLFATAVWSGGSWTARRPASWGCRRPATHGAGLAGAPSPGATNVRLTEGSESRDDLIAAMGTGLIVTGMIGASINATTGAYSRGASGFWVEGGEIAYPVNEVTIAGSLPDIVAGLRPANDAEPHRSHVVPSLLVEGLTVGA